MDIISSSTQEPPPDIDDNDLIHAQMMADLDALDKLTPAIDFSDPIWAMDTSRPTPTTKEILALEARNMRLVKAAMKRCRAMRSDKSSMSKKISIRISSPVLDLIRAEAARAGVPYQTYINSRLCEIATGHA